METSAIIIPTNGLRPNYLLETLNSVRIACPDLIIIIKPSGKIDWISELLHDGELVIDETSTGLSGALKEAIDSLPESISYFGWIGDDDLLSPDSIAICKAQLIQNPNASMAFGACQYIDNHGNDLRINRSGKFAARILSFGPCLVPQPGSLIRKDKYQQTEGIDTSLKWAFDLDLFLRLKRVGTLLYIRSTLSKYRWHADALTVKGRIGSIRESAEVRKKYLPKHLKMFSTLWEWPTEKIIVVVSRNLSK